MMGQLQNEEILLDEFDVLTQIANKCDEKGYNVNSFEFYNMEDECEICKTYNYILRVALVDNEILQQVYEFEKKFWNNKLDCVSSFKDLLNLQLNIQNSYLISLN